MRKGLLFLLLATVSMPAPARPDDDDRATDREAVRAERAERAQARSDARPERPAERLQKPEGPAAMRAVEPRIAPDRAMILERRPMVVEQRNFERGPEGFAGTAAPRPTLEQRGEAIDSVRDWRKEERARLRARGPKMVVPTEGGGDHGDSSGDGQGSPAVSLRHREVAAGGTLRERREERLRPRDAFHIRRPPVVSAVPRENTQPPPPAAARPASLATSHWRGDWRSDRRYDWRNHRRRHRSLFHFGFYFDPFGWSYRPYSIGWRLWPSYYRSIYWLNDPWRYRLPYAPVGYRWIRYYDDALLVDTWDGTVVDVIYGFFW
jgi:Ni/Co efflux regulator RcnB